jgi:PleD family two-component response regulator
VGVASAPARDPEAGEGPEAFLHAADTALYAAKSAGRDCVRSADQEVGNLSHESRVP